MQKQKRWILSLCFLMTTAPAVLAQTTASVARANPEGGDTRLTKRAAFSDVDMVSTANPHATRTALDILARGGSAIDAAIAAQMVLNLVEPQSSGIGGGAFLLTYDAKSKKVQVLDGRETAPAASKPTQFLKEDGNKMKFFDAVDSGLSVGVPGLVRMLEKAHASGGKLPWARLFEPAIDLAEAGFAVSPRMHASVKRRVKRIAAQPVAAAYFLDADGAPKAVGTVIKNPEFAEVLREIGYEGADSFYTDRTANAIVDAIRTHNRKPGVMTVEDLAGYQAIVREPLCRPYRKVQICGMPPPSSGALTMLQTLALLEQHNLAANKPDDADAIHLVSEAYRLAYADRARYIADPDFYEVPVQGLLDPEYSKARNAKISPRHSMGRPAAGQPKGVKTAGLDATRELPGTTHLSIVDRDGNAISMTSSIETAFGSMLMVRGFLLNNQLTDFSFKPADDAGTPIANRVEPGKRPRSSMAPTIVLNTNGELEASLGSPGGSSIIQYVTGTLLGMIDWRLNVQQAINAPHYGAKTSKTTTLEKGTSAASRQQELEQRSHKIRVRALNSGIHAVVFNGIRANGLPGELAVGQRRSRWIGGADPRREGVAAGH